MSGNYIDSLKIGLGEAVLSTAFKLSLMLCLLLLLSDFSTILLFLKESTSCIDFKFFSGVVVIFFTKEIFLELAGAGSVYFVSTFFKESNFGDCGSSIVSVINDEELEDDFSSNLISNSSNL